MKPGMANLSDQLTDEQVEHWRKALAMQFGPEVARLATSADIQAYRDRLQDWVDTEYGNGPEAEKERRA